MSVSEKTEVKGIAAIVCFSGAVIADWYSLIWGAIVCLVSLYVVWAPNHLEQLIVYVARRPVTKLLTKHDVPPQTVGIFLNLHTSYKERRYILKEFRIIK